VEFKKYMHVERFGTSEVENIEFGECYIFPKIDGSNGQIFFDEGKIKVGSRNRELCEGQGDNRGFRSWVMQQENIAQFFLDNPLFRLYGEWLVPHSLKTYREEAWSKFYVFDVEDNFGNLLHYDAYSKLLEPYGIEVIPPIAIINNPTSDNLTAKLPANTYLVQDGKGAGEGIVIKNYSFINKFGRQVWAKIVTSEFKEKHVKSMGIKASDGSKQVEQEIVNKYCSKALVDKVHANILNEAGGWQSKLIPRLLQTVYYDLIREESWNFIKEYKLPSINFKTLSSFTNCRVKELKPELF
jgi:hypothetical protein